MSKPESLRVYLRFSPTSEAGTVSTHTVSYLKI